MRHYHVNQGHNGVYMADENSVHKTKREAINSAMWSAQQARIHGYIVKGSATDGCYKLCDKLGEVERIEIIECDLDDYCE